MAIIFNHESTPIKTFNLYCGRTGGVTKGNSICDWSPRWYQNEYLVLDSYTNVMSKILTAKVNVPTKGTLYFDQSSKFPRFKLQGSEYKRCIKLDKADVIVVDDNCLSLIKAKVEEYKRSPSNAPSITIVEDEGIFYIIPTEDEDYYARDFIKRYGKANQTVFEVLRDNNMFSSKKVSITYQGPVTYLNKWQYEIYINVQNGNYPKFILDGELDRAISGTFESFDEEALNSIMEMLASEDTAIVDMGLKLIPNYNVLEFPLTISTMLRLNSKKCTYSKIWNSTSIKQLRATLNYTEPYSTSFPACINGVENENITYTDKDKAFASSLIREMTKAEVNHLVTNLENVVKCYGIKINAEVSN